MELDNVDEIIIKYLSMGFTQKETSKVLKKREIFPNSHSIIEKRLVKIRKYYGANTSFHLGIILGRMNKKEDIKKTGKFCTHCYSELVVKEKMFFWRGRYFTGLVCENCKTFWDNPEDSFEKYVGIKK